MWEQPTDLQRQSQQVGIDPPYVLPEGCLENCVRRQQSPCRRVIRGLGWLLTLVPEGKPNKIQD